MARGMLPCMVILCHKLVPFLFGYWYFHLQLSDNMSSHLKRLLNSSSDNFWASGLVFVMVRHQLAFMHNGEPIPGLSYYYTAISFKFYSVCLCRIFLNAFLYPCYCRSNYVGQTTGTQFLPLLQDFKCKTSCRPLFSSSEFQSRRL